MRLHPRSVILRQVDRVPRGHQPHPETLLAVLTREERRVATDIHGPEASDAAKHPSCAGQNRPHRKRIAQTAGFVKSCSRHKGFTGKMIAFSKTHGEKSLQLRLSQKAPLYHCSSELCQDYGPWRSAKEMPRVGHLLCTKYFMPVIFSLVEMMLGLPS